MEENFEPVPAISYVEPQATSQTGWILSDYEKRVRGLELATSTYGGALSTGEVVEVAKTFYRFLNGEATK